MSLSSEELERYARHIVLSDIGGPGQQLLKKAKVLVIGAGGLGTPVLQYLAAAGVGTLGVVDDDVVSLSNLQRQIIHDTSRVGDKKIESAKEALARINPNVSVEIFDCRLTEENANELIGKFDIIADGSDNFDTRFLVADTCKVLEKTLVTGAVGRFDGSLTTIKPHQNDENGQKYPEFRDIFPNKPPDGLLPSCAEAGVIGALTGVIGSMQALEIIKEITGAGVGLVGRLVLYDSLYSRFEEIKYGPK